MLPDFSYFQQTSHLFNLYSHDFFIEIILLNLFFSQADIRNPLRYLLITE